MRAAAASMAWGERMLVIVLMLIGVGELLAVGLTIQALVYPRWAYKQAHRSKVLWVLAGLVAFVPLMAYVVLVMWIIRGKGIVGAARPYGNARQAGRVPVGSSKAPDREWLTPKVCRSCGGSGGLRYCGCGNGWVTGSNGALEHCHRGCNYGKFYCNTCRGTGKA
jgi:hypothetical protein